MSTLLIAAAPSIGPAAPAQAALPGWAWPLKPPLAVIHPFIAPLNDYGTGHRGIDLLAVPGSTVHAPDDGVVHYAGMVAGRPVLSIAHAGGTLSSFEPVATELLAGAAVRQGEAIGWTVESPAAHCAQGCLHFGVRRNGQYVSPLNYLGGIPPSVLLPTRPIADRARG